MSRTRTCPLKVVAAVVAALGLSVVLAAAPAGAGTVPVFTDGPAPDDWAGPMGMTHPIAVGGTYVPLAMGCGDPVPERRILWYASGTAADSLWTNLNLPDSGSPTYTAAPVRVDGVFQPFVGDFDGDACDDIFWYAPGTATDVIWYFNTDGTHTSVPVRVDGTFTPVVGNWRPSNVADEILWYAPGTAADRWWSFAGGRSTPTSVAGTQIDGTYRPIRGIDRQTIIWFGPGSAPDSLWENVTSETRPTVSTVTLSSTGTFQTASIAGDAVVRDTAGPGTFYSVTLGFRDPGGSTLVPTGVAGTLAGAPTSPIMTDSTPRAGFGVLHGPGAAPDLILEPRRTPNGRVTSLDAGTLTPCAVQGDQVKCWGAAGASSIAAPGRGPLTSHVPLVVQGVANAVQVAAGTEFACARLLDTTVKCWGDDSAGQRGDGPTTTASNALPTTVSGLTGVAEITAGSTFACARLASGEVRCWGSETSGQLGDGGTLASMATSPVAVLRPVADGAGNLTAIASLDAGARHMCAVTTAGQARCWGDDTLEQLGDGVGATSSPRPVAVAGLTGVTSIGAGAAHSCARVGAGSVRCWGSDELGQTGDGGAIVTGAKVAVPSVVAGIADASSLSVGLTHTCVVLASTGQLRCWGDNQAGELGDGTLVNRSSPVVPRLAGGTAVTGRTVHAGGLLTCVRNALSAVQCWGYNIYGQTGSAYTRLADPTPRPVPNLDGGTFVIVLP